MATVTIQADVTIECYECGDPLDGEFRNGVLEVEPCEICLDKKFDEGKEEGREQGLEEGKQEGYDSGREDGREDGWREGYEEGQAEAIQSASEE